jgi:hypothetical protein
MRRFPIASLSLVLATLALAGCQPAQNNQVGSVSTPNPTSRNPTPPTPWATTNVPVTAPSVYVVSDLPQPEPYIVVFPQTASGATHPTVQIRGTLVSVDEDGNVYALVGSNVVEYQRDSIWNGPARSLPVGAGTKIAAVKDMVASPDGEIYISDGIGIAVFSATATGNADPVRYITGNYTSGGGGSTTVVPSLITLDSGGNLYVQDNSTNTIAIFKSTDTGNVTASRIISGKSSTTKQWWGVGGLTTDSAGNLYVSALWPSSDQSGNEFGVQVFDAAASGDAVPVRVITNAPGVDMYPYCANLGVGVDSAGTIYLSACHAFGGTPAVFEFAPGANGPSTPTQTITMPEWADAPESRIAVH